eukprot:04198_1
MTPETMTNAKLKPSNPASSSSLLAEPTITARKQKIVDRNEKMKRFLSSAGRPMHAKKARRDTAKKRIAKMQRMSAPTPASLISSQANWHLSSSHRSKVSSPLS